MNPLHAGIEIVLQLLRQLFPCGLVRGISLVTEAEPTVVHPAEVFRLVRGCEPLQEVDNTPCGRRVLASSCCEGT